jgi:hypothetical protein
MKEPTMSSPMPIIIFCKLLYSKQRFKIHCWSSVDVFFKRSDYTIAFEALWGLIPNWLVAVIHSAPTRQLQRFRNYMRVARRVAKSIVNRQLQSHATGKEGGKDVMSILGEYSYSQQYLKVRAILKLRLEPVRANLSEDPRSKLGEDEILSQLT